MQKKYILTVVFIAAVLALGSIYYSNTTLKPENHALTIMKFKASKPKVVSQKDERIAAIVNDEVISVEEIKKGYDSNPQIAEQIPFDEFYKKAVDVFVNGKLLYQAAVKAKTMETPQYQEELKVSKEDLARKLYLEQSVEAKVTPELIKSFYETEYLSKFVSQKEISAKHILVADESTAKQAIERLKNGADFDLIAKEYTKDKTVDLGYFTEDLMVPEFIDGIKTLKVGEYTKQPVKTQFGYHIVLLTDIRDSKPLPLSELEPQIKNILGQQAAAEIFDKLYQKAKIKKYDLEGNLIKENNEE